MENPRPDSKKPNARSGAAGDAALSPEEDPLWAELGATRVVDGPAASPTSVSVVGLSSPSNFTEFSPSCVLGKNVVALGDFQLVKKLGEGAMGAVYKARQISFNGEKLESPRIVALKVLFPHISKIPKLVERMYREGRTMGRLDHPNIIQAYVVDQAEGCHFVAMEYVSGQSAQKWLMQLGTMPVGDAVRITIDSARALAYAHGLNMVHRDIKPDNILLHKSGVVKIADFGMVKIADEEMSLTQTGHAVGTPWYMPLEQAKNAKEIDGRSDIYALGCTLYAFLTGQPPFMGQTIVDVIQAKELGLFPPARQSNSDVPERLDLLIAKMTAKWPKYRYQTCEDLIKDLEQLQLASETLSFIQRKRSGEQRAQDTPIPGKTEMLTKSKVDIDFAESAAPAHDPNVWFVQFKDPDGKLTVRKYGTAQLESMLDDGTMQATARASHNPIDGFRALGTYKEFQGIALSKNAKKAADKNTARYRGLYKRLEEEDRQRDEQEREANQKESAVGANTRYWWGNVKVIVPIVVVAVAFISFLAWLASGR